jgi:hypothetical protein
MRNNLILAGLILAAATSGAHAEIINLSCDDGGMLLMIDTGASTVSDKNPFQKTIMVSPLAVTPTAFTWRETPPGVDYTLDKNTRRITAIIAGEHGPEPVPLSNPQCGKSAVLLPK